MRVFPEGWVDGRGGGVGVCRLSRIMRVLVLLVLAITFVPDFCMCFESAYIHTQGYRAWPNGGSSGPPSTKHWEEVAWRERVKYLEAQRVVLQVLQLKRRCSQGTNPHTPKRGLTDVHPSLVIQLTGLSV